MAKAHDFLETAINFLTKRRSKLKQFTNSVVFTKKFKISCVNKGFG